MNSAQIKQFANDYYILIAIGGGIIIAIFYWLCCIRCLNIYREILLRNRIKDSDLYAIYNNADKCCQYKSDGNYVFINTVRGILCLDKSDVIDYKSKRTKHTRKRTRRVNGYTRSTYHSREYYTYHFKLITKRGVFKNTVGNNAVLEELSSIMPRI